MRSKDQQLLEEAYMLVLENQDDFKFIKEEELFVKVCSAELYKLIVEAIKLRGMPRTKRKLYDWQDGRSLMEKTVKKLNLPKDIEPYFDWFYDYKVYNRLAKLVTLMTPDRTKQPTLIFTDVKHHTVSTPLVSEKEKVLHLFEEFFRLSVKNAFLDEDNLKEKMTNPHFQAIYQWRESRLKAQETVERLPELEGIF